MSKLISQAENIKIPWHQQVFSGKIIPVMFLRITPTLWILNIESHRQFSCGSLYRVKEFHSPLDQLMRRMPGSFQGKTCLASLG